MEDSVYTLYKPKSKSTPVWPVMDVSTRKPSSSWGNDFKWVANGRLETQGWVMEKNIGSDSINDLS